MCYKYYRICQIYKLNDLEVSNVVVISEELQYTSLPQSSDQLYITTLVQECIFTKLGIILKFHKDTRYIFTNQSNKNA